jgi:hypothetical protein
VDRDIDGRDLPFVIEAADRLDALADTAELMGDEDAAAQWRARAWELRMNAMRLLDD